MTLETMVLSIISFYGYLIIAYVVMSWFPVGGAFADLFNVLGTLVDPYLALFRRVIPSMGAFDISPIVAILMLRLLSYVVALVL